jgi:hypothetical protein
LKSRLTALLSLLLLASAVFGLPVTRGIGSSRVCAEIVCEQREQRAEPAAPLRVAHDTPRPEAARMDAPAALLLHYSLFQRPPPAA